MLAEGNPLLSRRCRLRVTQKEMRHVHEWSGGRPRLHANQSELELVGSENGTSVTSDGNSNREAAYEYKRQKE